MPIILVDDTRRFAGKVLKTMKSQFNREYHQRLRSLNNRIKTLTKNYFKTTEIYDSLIGGDLMGHFGLPKESATSMVDAIVTEIGNMMFFSIGPGVQETGERLHIRFSLKIGTNEFFPSDAESFAELDNSNYELSKLVHMGEAYVHYTKINYIRKRFAKRRQIDDISVDEVYLPWLSWLLFRGTDMIIGDYHVEFIENHPNSRSGKAIMKAEGSWSVPSEYAGTADDNWITRGLRSGEYLRSVEGLMKEVLGKPL